MPPALRAPTPTLSRPGVALFAACWFAFANVAPAQTASPAPQPATASNANKDEVVTLSEFAVSTPRDPDYLAPESITGTRVVSKLRDLPFNVNVVTGEFIEDFAAFELREQFAYVSSFSPSEVQDEYQLRGFAATNQLRNGYRRLGLIDKVNVDRAEVIKGTAASIYGKVQPGGVINIITKKPRAKPMHRLSLAGGTHEFWRAQATSTGPLGGTKTLFYRQDIAATGRSFEQRFRENDQWTTSTQLLWRPDPGTRVSVEIEYLHRRERRGNAVPFHVQPGMPDPYRLPSQQRTYVRWTGLATELFWFNHQGPKEFNEREVFTLTSTFERQLNRHWSLRVGANWFDRGFGRLHVLGDAYRADLGAIVNGTEANTAARVPAWRPLDEGSTTLQADALGSFETGGIVHKLLLTLDYNRTTEDAYEARMAAATAALGNYVAPRLSLAAPVYDFVSFQENRSLYTDERENLRSTVDNWGVFVSERAAFAKGRVVALAGARFDLVENDVHDRLAGRRLAYHRNAGTYQLGVNVRLLRPVTIFANTSTTFLPQARFDADAAPLPNETGAGAEAGVKIVAPDDRFAVTLAYYDITRRNIARETNDPATGDRVVILSGRERSRGIEIDYNAQLTPALQFLGGYGYADAVTMANEAFPFLTHTTPRRVPRHTFGTALRYEIREGRLRGLYFTFGAHYASSSLVNPGAGRLLEASPDNPIVNTRMPNGLLPFPTEAEGTMLTTGSVRVGDGRETIENGSYRLFDASVGYRWRHRGKYLHKVQLNAKNLTNERYTWGSAAQGDPLTLIGTYTLTF